MFIPDPNFFYPGSKFFLSRIPDPHQRIEVFLTKKLFPSSWKYDPGGSSRIRILIFYPSRIQGSKRHLIPDPDPQQWIINKSFSDKSRYRLMALLYFLLIIYSFRVWPLVFLAMASAASLPELCAATRIFLMMRPPMEWPTKMTGRLPTPAASRRSRISSDLSSRNRRRARLKISHRRQFQTRRKTCV